MTTCLDKDRKNNFEVIGYYDPNFFSWLLHVNQYLDTFSYLLMELHYGGERSRFLFNFHYKG